MGRGFVAVIFIACFVGVAGAQEGGGAEPPVAAKGPCSDPERRQFDFWVGEWDVRPAGVTDPNRPPSHSRISVISGGCAVREEYETPAGYEGSSLNYYDAASHRWKQYWMDNQGVPVTQIGGLVDGKMIMDEVPDGAHRGRTTWTPLPDGRVRQLWEFSTDAGKTWQVKFDGIYTPRKSSD